MSEKCSGILGTCITNIVVGWKSSVLPTKQCFGEFVIQITHTRGALSIGSEDFVIPKFNTELQVFYTVRFFPPAAERFLASAKQQ